MRRLLILLLVVASAVLLFWRLDGALLWRDETTTATWARLMAEKGAWLPYVVDDGQLIVQGSDGHDFNSRMLPGMQGWLQFYVAAAAFKLFGVSTLTARLPFALLGVVCLFVLYRIGMVLFGRGLRPLLLPYLGILSIFFLFAARQSRYYILVVLTASLLLLEFFRYLRDPEIAAGKSFYARIGLYGLVLYLSNYVSFAGMWTALGAFVLLIRDKRLLKGFALLSGLLAVPCGVEFLLFRTEFASLYPPPLPLPLSEIYRMVLLAHGSLVWQMIPVVFLVPVGVYLFRQRAGEFSLGMKILAWLPVAAVAAPVLMYLGGLRVADAGAAVSWMVIVLYLSIPVTFLLCWRKLLSPGVWARAALLAGLVIVISVLLTVAVGKQGAGRRHYIQILPAALVLGALATAGLREAKGRRWAPLVFAGILIWPNLSFNLPDNEQVIENQFLRDDSYNGPFVGYLREHARPGDKIAVHRNVQGMVAYFYVPEMRWVALLDRDAPHNQQFRGRLPDDQFDDFEGADWYVIWDPRGVAAKKLSAERYEKVWEYSYTQRQNLWQRHDSPLRRSYEIYKRLPETASEPPGAGL
jgi:hypothetical protein